MTDVTHKLIAAKKASDKRQQEHIKLICEAWQRGVESIIETGRRLIKAKKALEHGDFESMLYAKLPFSPSTAQRLMAIAENPVLSKAAHVQVLPPSWGTLYELTKLPVPLLTAKIKDGTITPKLERKAACALSKPEPKTREEVVASLIDLANEAKAKAEAEPEILKLEYESEAKSEPKVVKVEYEPEAKSKPKVGVESESAAQRAKEEATFKDVASILRKLSNEDLRNLRVHLRGLNVGGIVSGLSFDRFSLLFLNCVNKLVSELEPDVDEDEEEEEPRRKRGKPQKFEESLEEAISSAVNHLSELGGECEEVVSDAPPGISETQRIQTLSDTADTLTGLSEPEVPPALADIKISYTITGKQNLSRWEQACVATSILDACTEALDVIPETDERYQVAQTLSGELQGINDEVEGCEFPGMYG